MPPRKRRTLRQEVVFEGIGIHTGKLSSVKIAPQSEGEGITFSFGTKSYGISCAASDGSMRSTTLIFPGGERIRTVEHLLSAIAGTGLDDARIVLRGEEVPILDGSAMPFAKAITSCGFLEFDSQLMVKKISVPICMERGLSFIAAIPSDELRVTYMIDFPGTSIGTEIKDAILTPDVFAEEIAPARTFCLASEAEALRNSGFGLGAHTDNVLVIGDENTTPVYRIDCECAAHKIADLLGDMALTGAVPCAHYICVRGGHKIHTKLADRIKRSFLER
jgi:UDP-3-O-[3-hydroxymyristoyl] N-acetylglucosamine deacetylase